MRSSGSSGLYFLSSESDDDSLRCSSLRATGALCGDEVPIVRLSVMSAREKKGEMYASIDCVCETVREMHVPLSMYAKIRCVLSDLAGFGDLVDLAMTLVLKLYHFTGNFG